ncbi:hypothetical protein G7076_08600 [Sphingomonas sp. HDW15A]|uniref:hypothetical protein n=1 Tax=Sphingomonas sp. HDW15A TaxID=2714942 RepID=UPI0014075590|nr:hypothetical protein [Sphingomonas sp. HDW15A]QIK96488.1 hypothetical protein G7076_08600 [Sphingomonas sp. HDW15A]
MIALLLASAALPHLTPDGWGEVRIGMSQVAVARALGTTLEGEPIEDEDTCVEKISERHPGMWFMFQEGKLTRISIGENSKVTTPRGLGIGASADAVRKAYSKGLKAEPHYYLGLPAEYLTYWIVAKKRGVRFETDARRRIETIHAGNDSIELVEGCA